MQEVMEVIQIARKGRYMNSLEKFHIFCTQKENKHMNEILFDPKNPIFNSVYNHYKQSEIHNTTQRGQHQLSPTHVVTTTH
jgi:hypothetical protein